MTFEDLLIKHITIKMIAKFKKYWEEIHGVMVIVIVLDPRHKFKLIEYFFPQIYGDRSATEIEKVRKCRESLEI